MKTEERVSQCEEQLRAYILDHGKAVGAVSWNMAMTALHTLIAHRKTVEAAWKSACPGTFERWHDD